MSLYSHRVQDLHLECLHTAVSFLVSVAELESATHAPKARMSPSTPHRDKISGSILRDRTSPLTGPPVNSRVPSPCQHEWNCLVREERLELSRLSAMASKTIVATITPLSHSLNYTNFLFAVYLCLYFLLCMYRFDYGN